MQYFKAIGILSIIGGVVYFLNSKIKSLNFIEKSSNLKNEKTIEPKKEKEEEEFKIKERKYHVIINDKEIKNKLNEKLIYYNSPESEILQNNENDFFEIKLDKNKVIRLSIDLDDIITDSYIRIKFFLVNNSNSEILIYNVKAKDITDDTKPIKSIKIEKNNEKFIKEISFPASITQNYSFQIGNTQKDSQNQSLKIFEFIIEYDDHRKKRELDKVYTDISHRFVHDTVTEMDYYLSNSFFKIKKDSFYRASFNVISEGGWYGSFFAGFDCYDDKFERIETDEQMYTIKSIDYDKNEIYIIDEFKNLRDTEILENETRNVVIYKEDKLVRIMKDVKITMKDNKIKIDGDITKLRMGNKLRFSKEVDDLYLFFVEDRIIGDDKYQCFESEIYSNSENKNVLKFKQNTCYVKLAFIGHFNHEFNKNNVTVHVKDFSLKEFILK
jgi:hypothetical protein